MAHATAPIARTGQIIGERYEILNVVGSGGQSVVYRARDMKFGDEVALKVLKGEFVDDSDSRNRMFREAQAMMSLQGTAAVRVMDQQWLDHAPVLVTEFLHGKELGDHLSALEATGERASLEFVIDLMTPIVNTLETAHSRGIVHRDLKPANIFLVDSAHGGGVKLLDFGFAKFTRIRGFTAENMVAGSPSYIAPEAWKGKRDLDHRIDVYALGAIIFRCLGGHTPFENKDLVELLKAVTSAPRPSLHALRNDLPKEIDDWVEQALAIERDLRFVRVIGLWKAFRSIVGR
jgi:serine/threonine-protein kinase